MNLIFKKRESMKKVEKRMKKENKETWKEITGFEVGYRMNLILTLLYKYIVIDNESEKNAVMKFLIKREKEYREKCDPDFDGEYKNEWLNIGPKDIEIQEILNFMTKLGFDFVQAI